MSAPWIMHAQTLIPPGVPIHNPTTFVTGALRGEVGTGYAVPAGKVLHLKRAKIEPLWSAAVVIYTGAGTSDATWIPANTLGTFSSGGQFGSPAAGVTPPLLETMVKELDYWIVAGQQVNVRLSSGWTPSGDWIYGWEVTGELLDA